MPARLRPQSSPWMFACLLVVLIIAATPRNAAAVPPLLNYQGYLSDTGGPLTGSYEMTFSLFAEQEGGTVVWSESYPAVTVAAGVFNVLLGSESPLPLGSIFTGQTLWIETVVAGNTMSPRRPIVSVAYAARAAVADSSVSAPTAVPAGLVIYTRWGRTTCPPGASTVYQGYASSGNYQHTGSGRNMLCLTNAPTFGVFNDANQNGALIYGTEYKINGSGLQGGPMGGLTNQNAPCTVCLREDARVSLMIPGTNICPAGWNLEYAGYLMSTHYTLNGGEFVCVDQNAEGTGGPVDQGGHLWYPTEAECGSLPCAPYVQDRELTCAVCTKP